jgi:hypothetical protein
LKRYLVYLTLSLLILGTTLPLMAGPNAFEDSLPICSGMRLSFQCSFGHLAQKERLWNINITKADFPDSITYTWIRTEKKNQLNGTRILTDLKASRDFEPRFKKNELNSTSDTAPWVSLQVLKELREYGAANNFREGGSGVTNWKAASLKNLEKIIYPVFINGKPEALHAFRVSRGMVIWNNLQNPLVLEYEPLGIPLVTNVTGWKLTAINY